MWVSEFNAVSQGSDLAALENAPLWPPVAPHASPSTGPWSEQLGLAASNPVADQNYNAKTSSRQPDRDRILQGQQRRNQPILSIDNKLY